jgi:hypothetical protein
MNRRIILTFALVLHTLMLGSFQRQAHGDDDMPPLSVKDHTEIIKSLMENSGTVLERLQVEKHKQARTCPSGEEVLKAALGVEQIDTATKARIKVVLQGFAALKRTENHLRDSDKKALIQIDCRIDKAESLEQMIGSLNELENQYGGEKKDIAAGIDVAIQIVKDGSSTIYSEKVHFYQTLPPSPTGNGTKAAIDVAKADVKGAATGAAAGAVIGGPGGAVGGAVGLAVINSAWAVFSRFFD